MTETEVDGETRRPPTIAAVACAAMALLLAWAAATGDARLRVPPLVAIVLAVALMAAAWRVMRMREPGAGSGDGAATVILGAFTVACLWLAVGPGARVCGVAFASRPLPSATGFGCRVPFGIGALLCGAATAYAMVRWNRRRVVGGLSAGDGGSGV